MRAPGSGAAALALAVGFVGVALAVRVLTGAYNHDEEQYVAAAVLTGRGLKPVLDFPYLQTPLQPWLFGPLLAGAGERTLLDARLLGAACAAAACLLAVPILRLQGRSLLAGALAAVWLAGSGAAETAMSAARNDTLPLLLATGGLLALGASWARTRRPGGAWALQALAGLLFAAAAASKVSYLFAPVAGAVALAWHAPVWGATGGGLAGGGVTGGRRRLAGLVAYAAGAFVGALPILITAALAPAAAGFDWLRFHRLASPDWYRLNGLGAELSLSTRLVFWLKAPLADPALLAALAVIGWRLVLGRRGPPLTPAAGLTALLLVGSGLLAFLISPPHPTYLVAPTVFAILLAAQVWPARARGGPVGPLLVLVALLALAGDYQLGRHLLWLPRPARWTTHEVAGEARALRRALAAAPAGPVASVSPIRVIEAGRPIYPAFAPGPFVFRSADVIDPATAARSKAAVPAGLDALFAATPPAAVLTGLETHWRVVADARLAAWARAHGFAPRTLPSGALLFLRPAVAPPEADAQMNAAVRVSSASAR